MTNIQSQHLYRRRLKKGTQFTRLSLPKILNSLPHDDEFLRAWEKSLMETLWEKEKFLVQAMSPFPTMSSTLSKREIIIFVTFNFLSANAFNLVWSKILLSGYGILVT